MSEENRGGAPAPSTSSAAFFLPAQGAPPAKAGEAAAEKPAKSPQEQALETLMQRTVKDFSDRWSQATRANIAAMKTLGRKVNANEELLVAQQRSLGALRSAFEAVHADQASVDAALTRLAADQLSLESALDGLDRELAKVLDNRLPGAAAERESLVQKAQEVLRRAKTQDYELFRAIGDLNVEMQRAGGSREAEPSPDTSLSLLLNHFHQSVSVLELRLQGVQHQVGRLGNDF